MLCIYQILQSLQKLGGYSIDGLAAGGTVFLLYNSHCLVPMPSNTLDSTIPTSNTRGCEYPRQKISMICLAVICRRSSFHPRGTSDGCGGFRSISLNFPIRGYFLRELPKTGLNPAHSPRFRREISFYLSPTPK